MKRAIILLLVILAVACCVRSAQGAIITIAIEAVVDDVQDSDNYLDGLVHIGDLITGTYIYDTDTPDSNPSANVGDYEHLLPPCGISLSVDGLDFMTDPANTNFLIEIVNNYASVDAYSVISYGNLPLSSGTMVNKISWALRDYSEAAISSIDLPATGPILNDWDLNFLNIGGGKREREGFVFAAHVTSTVVIPEPMTALLLALGGVLFFRRSKQ